MPACRSSSTSSASSTSTGAEIDYVDSLMGSGFAINNPNAVSSCACGSSFNTDGAPAKAGGCAH